MAEEGEKPKKRKRRKRITIPKEIDGLKDSARILKWMQRVADTAPEATEEVIEGILQDAAKIARADIDTNAIRPPSKKDGTTLIDSGAYRRRVGVYSRDDGVRYVGLPPKGNHRPSRLPWKVIYDFITYGTAHTPARPHIEPAFQRSMKNLKKRIRQAGFVVD